MKAVIATLRTLLPLLPEGARRFLLVFMVVTSALAILDVAALMLLAVSLRLHGAECSDQSAADRHDQPGRRGRGCLSSWRPIVLKSVLEPGFSGSRRGVRQL